VVLDRDCVSRTTWKRLAQDLDENLTTHPECLYGLGHDLLREVHSDLANAVPRKTIMARVADRHYGIVAPLVAMTVVAFQKVVSGPEGRLIDEAGDLRPLVRRSVNSARGVKAKFALAWEPLPSLIGASVEDVYTRISSLPGGPVLLRAAELNLGIIHTPRQPPPSLLKADIAGQLNSAMSLMRKLLSVVPTVYAQHGVSRSLSETREVLARSQLPLGLAMLDGMRLAAVDRVLCGCTSACYEEIAPGRLSRDAPHHGRFEREYEGDLGGFRKRHPLEGWYTPDAFGVYGREHAMWPAVDFSTVKDPGEGRSPYGAVAISETPVLSGRRCPGVFGGAIERLQRTAVELIGVEEILGHALAVASSTERATKHVLPTEVAPPLPFDPPRRMPLLSKGDGREAIGLAPQRQVTWSASTGLA
jgi:hypothetical protein